MDVRKNHGVRVIRFERSDRRAAGVGAGDRTKKGPPPESRGVGIAGVAGLRSARCPDKGQGRAPPGGPAPVGGPLK